MPGKTTLKVSFKPFFRINFIALRRRPVLAACTSPKQQKLCTAAIRKSPAHEHVHPIVTGGLSMSTLERLVFPSLPYLRGHDINLVVEVRGQPRKRRTSKMVTHTQ